MGGGGAPAQQATYTYSSPFQNPAYTAVAMGTKQTPGPLARSIQIGNQLAQNWQDSYTGKNPGAYYGITKEQATPQFLANQRVQQGAWSPSTSQTASGVNAFDPNRNRFIAEANPNLSPQTAKEGGIMSLRKFADGGDTTPRALTGAEQRWLKSKQQQADAGKLTGANKEHWDKLTGINKAYQANQQRQTSGVNAPYSMQQAVEQQTAYFDPITGRSTNPLFNQAVGRIQEAQTLPSQFGQATDAYNKAISGLSGLTNYTPQQIEAAKIARGDIRDVNAQMAQVERMQGGPNVQAIESERAAMQGPETWTQPGVSQKYMSPYMQNVVDIQKREANRDFAKQMAAMDARAAGQGAYGGSRQAIERSEARRAQAQRLGDIEAQGLQQAYGQGMGQFQAESQLGQAARQANLGAAMQANLANQQAGMSAQQLNQMYGQGGFGAQQANMAAQNQAYNNYVRDQLTAQGMNQGMDWQTASQNATMQMQAAMANQQAGLQANQQNIGAYGQMMQGAQGLGGLGAQQAQTNLANIGALGQAAQAQQNLGQQYLNNVQQSAQNYFNFPQQQLAPSINAINQLPSSGGVSQQTQRPASAMGWKKGGLMNLRKARGA